MLKETYQRLFYQLGLSSQPQPNPPQNNLTHSWKLQSGNTDNAPLFYEK